MTRSSDVGWICGAGDKAGLATEATRHSLSDEWSRHSNLNSEREGVSEGVSTSRSHMSFQTWNRAHWVVITILVTAFVLAWTFRRVILRQSWNRFQRNTS